MDDKLRSFLDGDEKKPKKKPVKKPEPPKEEENKYDKFFSDDADEWIDKAKENLGKAGEFLGDSLKETGRFLGDSLKETGRFFKEGSEEANKFMKDKVVPKAKEKKAELDEKVDKWTEKLKDYSESPIKKTKGAELDESLMDTHSDFFSKAAKFADKLEGKDKDKPEPKPGELRLLDDGDEKKDKPKDGKKMYGFDDLDGDGDEWIDDAILDLD